MNKSLPLALSLSLIGVPLACGGDDSDPGGAGGSAGSAGQDAGGATSSGSGGAANGGTTGSTGGSGNAEGGSTSSSTGGASTGGMPGTGGAVGGQGGDGNQGGGSARDALCDAICATEAELECPPADAEACAENWCTGDDFLEGACTTEYEAYLACLAAEDTDAFECFEDEPFPLEATCAEDFGSFADCAFGGGGGAGGEGGGGA